MFTLIGRGLQLAGVAGVIIFASYWNFRLAIAERLSTSDSIAQRKRATELVPGDSRNWIRLAEIQQKNGIEALTAFSRAANASPLDAKAWIGMGLEQEISGNFARAEQDLLHAARISREYVPRWTLANYYFRRDDAEHFWPWAKQALQIGAGDLQPIFRMAWSLSQDADRIAAKAIPSRPAALAQYLVWLTATGKLDPADAIASRLLPIADKDDAPALLLYCDRQLGQGHFPAAMTVWNGSIARRLLAGEPIPTSSGIENGAFSREPLNLGFDWHFLPLEGVVLRSTFPGLRVNFSGKEPVIYEIFFQYVPLEPDRRYRLEYEYRTAAILPAAGLTWRVFDPKTALEFTKDPPSLAHEQPVRESLTFNTPHDISGGRLALTYRRAPGTTRIEGWLQLNHVALRPAN